MRSPLLPALFALAHAAAPPAAELDLSWSTFPDGTMQGRLVYLDVLGTPVPPVELVDGDGRRFKLNLKVSTRPRTEEVLIQPFLFAVVETRKGEKLVPLGDTEVRTTSGARASVRFGTDGKTPAKRGIELDFRPTLDAGPRLPSPPPPEAAPAAPTPEAEPAAPKPDQDDEFLGGGTGERARP